MFESAQDLISVLVGLVVLWFLFGALINSERAWREQGVGQRRRHRLAGPRGASLLGRLKGAGRRGLRRPAPPWSNVIAHRTLTRAPAGDPSIGGEAGSHAASSHIGLRTVHD
jgi:hypothetical protein